MNGSFDKNLSLIKNRTEQENRLSDKKLKNSLKFRNYFIFFYTLTNYKPILIKIIKDETNANSLNRPMRLYPINIVHRNQNP